MSNIKDRVAILDGMYTMEPSEAFQGIEVGLVKVIERGVADNSNYKSDIEEYALVCAEEDCTPETIWVAYEYTNSDSYADIEVLPEIAFMEHATIY